MNTLLNNLPSKEEAQALLHKHVTDPYQRHHALMVATAMEGYAEIFNQDSHLWFITGYLHDIDFQEHPTEHPGPSLTWFAKWDYPTELIHAVEAHAYLYNGFTTEPKAPLASALMACDELCGIFYAYSKVNPIAFSEMKTKSIKKRLKESSFAPKIDRSDIERGVGYLGIEMGEHIDNVKKFLGTIK